MTETSGPRLTRWAESRRPDEQTLRAVLSAESLAPYAWGNPPGDRYPAHAHTYHKIVYCLEGSISFDLGDGKTVDLSPGDRLDLPGGLVHSARVGPTGVVCLEAHRNR